jgi:hypothetical protein
MKIKKLCEMKKGIDDRLVRESRINARKTDIFRAVVVPSICRSWDGLVLA